MVVERNEFWNLTRLDLAGATEFSKSEFCEMTPHDMRLKASPSTVVLGDFIFLSFVQFNFLYRASASTITLNNLDYKYSKSFTNPKMFCLILILVNTLGPSGGKAVKTGLQIPP